MWNINTHLISWTTYYLLENWRNWAHMFMATWQSPVKSLHLWIQGGLPESGHLVFWPTSAHWSSEMYGLCLDLLVCKLFKVPKIEDSLDIFLAEFLDPKLFFMKQFCELERTLRLESYKPRSNCDSATGPVTWLYRLMMLIPCLTVSKLWQPFLRLKWSFGGETFHTV